MVKSIIKLHILSPGWNNATGVKSSLGLVLGIPNTVLFADTAYFQVSIFRPSGQSIGKLQYNACFFSSHCCQMTSSNVN